MPAIVIMSVWKSFGYNMIIFIAGLQNIPEDLYEAASLEGAGEWQKFKSITLPLLAPTTLFISIITIVGYFQLFAEPYIMTQGGPLNSTLSIVQYMYQEGFRWWNMGYSASIAFVLFFIILIVTIIQFKVQKSSSDNKMKKILLYIFLDHYFGYNINSFHLDAFSFIYDRWCCKCFPAKIFSG